MLPDATQAVFDAVKDCPGIEDYLLVGGTALALRLHHRISEDLDFLSNTSLRPRHIQGIMDRLRDKGCRVLEVPGADLLQEFEDTGLEASYAQIRFNVDGVKLEFFHYIPLRPSLFNHPRIKPAPVADMNTGRIRVAALDSIFYLKALLVPVRSSHRDLFDLLTLMRDANYSMEDLFAVVREQELLHDIYVRQLLYRPQASDDPGVSIPGQPAPSYKHTIAMLEERISDWEQQEAAKSRR